MVRSIVSTDGSTVRLTRRREEWIFMNPSVPASANPAANSAFASCLVVCAANVPAFHPIPVLSRSAAVDGRRPLVGFHSVLAALTIGLSTATPKISFPGFAFCEACRRPVKSPKRALGTAVGNKSAVAVGESAPHPVTRQTAATNRFPAAYFRHPIRRSKPLVSQHQRTTGPTTDTNHCW